jgi:carboxyl-terminal processing protease
MPRLNLAWVLLLPAAVVTGLVVSATAPPPDKDYQLVRQVVDVLAEVDEHYVRELNDKDKQKLVEDMINGGLSRLDPHSEYLNPEERERFESQNEGQYGGVGLMIGYDVAAKRFVVETPLPNSPALAAGCRTGDYLLKVDGVPVDKILPDDPRTKVRGAPGSKVTLTLLTPGDPAGERDVILTRSEIPNLTVSGFARDPADPAKWDFLADKGAGIAYVRIQSGFSEKTGEEVKAALAAADTAGAKALVLDLRGNPGGLLNQAVDVADLFLPASVVVSTRDRRNIEHPRNAKTDKTPWESAADRPMAVLVDEMSASASEIVAAALQDHKRAVVVGTRSYGKGSVQRVYNLPASKAAVKLTVEAWLRPSGASIDRPAEPKDGDAWGVEPDQGLSVKLTPAERQATYKAGNFRFAIRPKESAEVKGTDEAKDKVLDTALDYLRKKLKDGARAPNRLGPVAV